MTAMFRKLKSKAGESLVESLAAILIFTMASVVMFPMISAANDINGKAKVKDAENQANLIAVEKGEEEYKSGDGTVTFTIQVSGTGGTTTTQPIADVDVDVYGSTDTLYAYFMDPNAGESGG